MQKILLFYTPIMVVILSVNYFGDAAHIFDVTYEKKMAEIILDGSSVTNFWNCDERNLQKNIIKNWTSAPDVSAIGSSRVMQMRQSHFPKHTFFNNSVSSADIKDLTAIYQLYEDRGLLLQSMILGVDPGIFDEHNQGDRWKSLSEEYFRFRKVEYIQEGSLQKYGQLFSVSYFQGSFKKLMSGSRFENPRPIQTTENESTTILPDGSFVYGHSFRNQSRHEVLNHVENYLNFNIKQDGLKSISKDLWTEFEGLIKDMQQNKVKVQLLLTPYHPKIFEVFQAEHLIIEELEQKITNFASANDIVLMGSYNPNHYLLEQDVFFDAVHVKEAVIENFLLEKLNK